jgi:hypothetical protein
MVRESQAPETQARDLLDTYAQSQERLLGSWTTAVERFQVRTADEELWGRLEQLTERPLQVFQEQTRSLVDAQLRLMLNAQSVLARYWLANFNPAQYLPTLLDNWAWQTQRLAERNAEATRQAVERFLVAGKRFDPLKVTEAWSGTFKRSVEAFEEVSREIADRQQALVEQTEKETAEAAKKVAAGAKKAAERAGGEHAA